MIDFYFTAFLFGLAGSFHCVGMCAPVMLSVPMDLTTKIAIFIDSAIYNLGRITTYGMIGMFFSFIGMTAHGFCGQQYLSISVGVLILILYFGLGKKASFLEKFILVRWLKSCFSKLLQTYSFKSLFFAGILTGFLPCGLVYAAAAGAILGGTIERGMIYMISFGLGTLPVMFVVSVSRRVFKDKIRYLFKNITPYAVIMLSAMMIIRGLGLGIPYLSPVAETLDTHQISVECCEVPVSE